MVEFIWKWNSNVLTGFFFPWSKLSIPVCRTLLELQIDEFWEVANDTWDLIFVDEFFAPCGIAIAELHSAPNIIFHTSLLNNPSAEHRGIPGVPHLSPAFLGVQLSGVWSVENFFDRLGSVTETWVIHLLTYMLNRLIRSATGNLLPNFSLQEYTRNAAAAFVDYPGLIDWPRPRGLDFIYIGCHCKATPTALPEDLELFVNDPKSKGTILVAFGTLGNWAIAPQRKTDKSSSQLWPK